MAKSKAKKQNKVARPRQSSTPRVPRPLAMKFNDAGRRYANLLADPCNGDLVPGPFGDGSGGMVGRFEREFLIVGGAGSTACAFAYSPRANNFCFATGTSITDTSTITWTNNSDASVPPGLQFMQANASSVRPLACCMQVYWTGSELNRQGVVSLARMPAEVVDDTTLTVARLRSASQYSERTPDTYSEIIWRPQEQDQYFTSIHPTVVSSPGGGSQNTVLVMTGAYLPVDTPLRIRVVVVFEWIPDPLSGFKVTTGRMPTPPTRLGDVLAFLDRTGDWMAGTANSAARAISKVGAGVGGLMSLGRGVGRLGTALLAAA